jgi:hypothetical protein
MQWEMLKLAKQLGRLLTHAEAGFHNDAVRLLSSCTSKPLQRQQRQEAGEGKEHQGLGQQLQERSWLAWMCSCSRAQPSICYGCCLLMAVNNRPPLNAGVRIPAVQIQQVCLKVGGSIPVKAGAGCDAISEKQ